MPPVHPDIVAVGIVRKPYVGDTVNDFGYGTGAALLPAEQSTAPIGRIRKVSILDVLVSMADQFLRSSLADPEPGHFHSGFRKHKPFINLPPGEGFCGK